VEKLLTRFVTLRYCSWYLYRKVQQCSARFCQTRLYSTIAALIGVENDTWRAICMI